MTCTNTQWRPGAGRERLTPRGKTLNGFEITTPVPEGIKAADSNVIRYRAVTAEGELIVQIAKHECINDMSGKKSDYSVSIDVKNNTDKNYTNYKGCGEYLSGH